MLKSKKTLKLNFKKVKGIYLLSSKIFRLESRKENYIGVVTQLFK